MTPLLDVSELASLLGRDDVVIADCRFALSDTWAGFRAYTEAHIPGAVYFHLDENMSAPPEEHGGRHPLPCPDEFMQMLGASGVGPGIQVVAYDDVGPFAARLWWLLRWLGHDQVRVLDGGWHAWLRAGLPTTAAETKMVARQFTPRLRPAMVASMEEVLNRPPGVTVIDARAPHRFAGAPDPLDPKPGHIPGAVNRFWQQSLQPDGRWKSPAEQAARFAGLPADVIHHCGSGVTACANLLAMAIAGLPEGRLYPGSWSDWCSYPENPIAL